MKSFVAVLMMGCAVPLAAQKPDVETIIQRSVEANQADFNAAPDFNYKERDRNSDGTSKTYQVTMIEGTPYQRLIEINGKPISAAQQAQEKQKQEQVAAQRRAESRDQQQKRIADFEKGRQRDHDMMEQLTKAFNFKITGTRKLRGFSVWQLKATPRPGYNPPNMHAQVLPGMQGQLWIDQKTYQWVKVTAQVIHPVSIEGFLAQVEPGTRFELEKSPVDGGTWQITHFAMKSEAKVLFLFNHNSQEDSTYFDYQRISDSSASERLRRAGR
jgi:hypothetical protein